jgi:hypothetical protein
VAIDRQRSLNVLALHVTITDDDSHRVSESQTIPADESVESDGTCHCFPQRVSVVRAAALLRVRWPVRGPPAAGARACVAAREPRAAANMTINRANATPHWMDGAFY